MPAHANKRFPDLSVEAAVAAANKLGETRCIGVANLNAYLNRFGAVLNWATDEGYIQRNPARGLKLPDPVKKRDNSELGKSSIAPSFFLKKLATSFADQLLSVAL